MQVIPLASTPTAAAPAPEVQRAGPRGKAPRTRPLSSWARLLPILERCLRTANPGRALDRDRLVRDAAFLRVCKRLPRRQRLGWAARIWIVLDKSVRLIPLWRDQAAVVHHLLDQAGAASVDVDVWDTPPARDLGARICRSVPPETPILVLSDLGHYGDVRARFAWKRLGNELRDSGYRLTALIPVPPQRWHLGVCAPWNAVPWEKAIPSEAAEASSRSRSVERVVRLLSSAIRVEPGLLRAVRDLLPPEDADVSTELEVWNHSAMQFQHAAGGTLDPLLARSLRLELGRGNRSGASGAGSGHRSSGDEKLVRDAVALQRTWRSHLAPMIAHEEALAQHSAGVPGVEDEWLDEANAYLKARAAQLVSGMDARERQKLLDYFERLIERVDDDFFQRIDDEKSSMHSGRSIGSCAKIEVNSTTCRRDWIPGRP